MESCFMTLVVSLWWAIEVSANQFHRDPWQLCEAVNEIPSALEALIHYLIQDAFCGTVNIAKERNENLCLKPKAFRPGLNASKSAFLEGISTKRLIEIVEAANLCHRDVIIWTANALNPCEQCTHANLHVGYYFKQLYCFIDKEKISV